MAKSIEDLRQERAGALAQINRAGSTIKQPEVADWDLAVLSLKLTILNKAWNEYQEKHAALMAHAEITDEEVAAFDADAIAAAQIYSRPRALLDTHADAIKQLSTITVCKASEISVPIFNGAYTSWVPWRSEFISKVKNTVLPPGDKIDLLRKALSGEARGRIGEPDRRDAAEFEAMWQLLESTYDHQYQIIVGHVNAIMDIKPMPSASAVEMRKMIDVLDRELRALQRFEYDTESWSPLLAVMILRKLDRVTLEGWEKERVPTDKPVLADLKKFLEKRILTIRNLELSCWGDEGGKDVHDKFYARARSHERVPRYSNYRQLSAPNPFRQVSNPDDDGRRAWKRSRPVEEPVSTPQAKPPCKICPKSNHGLWFCHRFKGWTLPQRLKYVEDGRICPCCLFTDKHTSVICPAPGCPRCDGAKHNQVLCPKAAVFRTNVARKAKRRAERQAQQNNN